MAFKTTVANKMLQIKNKGEEQNEKTVRGDYDKCRAR